MYHFKWYSDQQLYQHVKEQVYPTAKTETLQTYYNKLNKEKSKVNNLETSILDNVYTLYLVGIS